MRSAALCSFAVLALATTIVFGVRAQEPPPAVDPVALELLRESTEYLGSLQQFSVNAHNFHEDLTDMGNRVDFEMEGQVTVSRPNKLRGERQDDWFDQVLIFDGQTLTLFNPLEGVYASEPVSGTIEDMFEIAQSTLGLFIPITDLLRQDVFPLLIQDVTLAMVIGQETVDGIICDHLLFSRPGVDFQIWVADDGPPLPHKFVVTDTATPELLSIVTRISGWDLDPVIPDGYFDFVPPEGARGIHFLKLDLDGETNQ